MLELPYARLALIAFVVLLFPAGYLKGCVDEKARFDQYKGAVEAVGQEQERRTATRIAHDALLKEETDEENRKAHDRLLATIGKLRRDAYSSQLPAAPAGSSRPDLACFDRAEYQREDGAAFERLRAGARSLADEGTASTVDLDTGKRWALKAR